MWSPWLVCKGSRTLNARENGDQFEMIGRNCDVDLTFVRRARRSDVFRAGGCFGSGPGRVRLCHLAR